MQICLFKKWGSRFVIFISILFFEVVNAQTGSFPNKPIKIIIPFPPGNTTDLMARLIAPKLSERLGQQVIVENRPGASGMLGLDLVAKSAPDGYTLGAGQGGNLVVLPHTSKSVPYDALKDFTPIARTAMQPLAQFHARMEQYIAEIKAVPLAKGFDEVFYPGEIEANNNIANRRDGLLLPEDTLADLARIAEETGLTAQLPFAAG